MRRARKSSIRTVGGTLVITQYCASWPTVRSGLRASATALSAMNTRTYAPIRRSHVARSVAATRPTAITVGHK
jgi:hypothetical protein